jgi:hypothetical protein
MILPLPWRVWGHAGGPAVVRGAGSGRRPWFLSSVTAHPAGERTVQQARNLSRSLDKRFEDIKFLIRDRGPDFTRSFDAVFQAAGARILRAAVQAPRTNAIRERLAGTLRRELPGRMLILGEAHLRAVLAEYQAHYHAARPHQGIAQRVPGRRTRPTPHHRYRPRQRADPPKTRAQRSN